MAPIKALCTERQEDWTAKFGPLGLKSQELTGDSEMDDYFELQDVNIILTTPVRLRLILLFLELEHYRRHVYVCRRNGIA